MFWLLSYPRSGNTFVRYCVEYISKRPSVDHPSIGKKFPELGVDLSAPVIMFKSHRWKPDNMGLEGADGLIALVRDYKECIPRHYKENPKHKKDLFNMFVSEVKGIDNETGADYISVLQAYDQRIGPKHFIYYEDLILKPRQTIIKLAEFIGFKNDHLEDLLNNYDKHQKFGIKAYHAKSHSLGKDIKFHQKQLDKNILNKMTAHLKKVHPDLFQKYLTRYE